MDGNSLDDARPGQQCRDIDECRNNNGGCVPNSQCINNEVRSFVQPDKLIHCVRRENGTGAIIDADMLMVSESFC